MVDKPSLEKINTLHPYVRESVKNIVNCINTNVLTGNAKVRIAQATRTFAEQDKLYAQRPKVTNAKGGDSIHNYGLAVDIVLIIDGKTASWDTKKDWDGDKQSDWMEIVKVFKDSGWSWGGDWRTFKDMPHFENTKENTLSQLKSKYKAKNFIKGTEFVNL